MILRDAVHGLVALEGEAEALIEKLLRTREVQRLRRVRQLGLASLVFPGAEHSRFSHALGAAHVMLKLQKRLVKLEPQLESSMRMTREDKLDALAASFLHDLGHGPFSHLFEEVLPQVGCHETWTSRIILDDQTDVCGVLRNWDSGMPERVVALLKGQHRLPYLSHAISGTLDVDRCDYLLRDNHTTGVRYGLYDLDWLFQALCFAQVEFGEKPWVLAIEGRKGLPSIEGFFVARHFMYQQVYHHKATRAAEALIRAIFVRVGELLVEPEKLPALPAALRTGAGGKTIALGDYLELDDSVLLACFARWQHGPDKTLAELCANFLSRKLPKTAELVGDGLNEALWEQAYQRAKAVVDKAGFRADLHVWLDVAQNAPYAEPVGDSPDGVWVSLRGGEMKRLGDISFLLGQLRNKVIYCPRLIFPENLRPQVLAAIKDFL
ncbi:MAG: HD domain-containing protein [Myxococcales bacterium]|nr:MAG: HD domain-containing protein [Myxococcales bacterium]